jgi:hypothetical protein
MRAIERAGRSRRAPAPIREHAALCQLLSALVQAGRKYREGARCCISAIIRRSSLSTPAHFRPGRPVRKASTARAVRRTRSGRAAKRDPHGTARAALFVESSAHCDCLPGTIGVLGGVANCLAQRLPRGRRRPEEDGYRTLVTNPSRPICPHLATGGSLVWGRAQPRRQGTTDPIEAAVARPLPHRTTAPDPAAAGQSLARRTCGTIAVICQLGATFPRPP